MKERTLDAIVVGAIGLLILAVFIGGCRLLRNNPHLWL